MTPRPAPPAPPPPPFGSDSSESDSATDSDSDSSKKSKKRKAKASSPTKRSVASSNSSAPIPTPAPATILSVASIATRQIPTVEALNTLTRASIDKFKLAIEALRRANDQTALDVFIPEPIQDLLTLKLFVTKQIKRDRAKYWKAWDDRKFFDVLQEVFPGDKRRSEDEYQTTLSRLNDVRLDIDFSLHDSELKYVSRVQKILIEAGGEKKFHRNQRQEFVKSMIRNIGSNLGSRYNDEVLRRLHQHLRAQQISRVKSLLCEILRWIEPVREHWTFGEECGWHKPRALVKETGNPKPMEPQLRIVRTASVIRLRLHLRGILSQRINAANARGVDAKAISAMSAEARTTLTGTRKTVPLQIRKPRSHSAIITSRMTKARSSKFFPGVNASTELHTKGLLGTNKRKRK